eukprot:CAMPEP_0171267438 /NCGR_PEP_ID=MMETSP0790-20130122/59156_1 /TAXON_ID=2925 /ORGANISM="Alexandrium catenella, Strain OF101" /LENGTH=33 /DNA_ID= /DNA_START= /DNA_END= /DNA_ORIENTATION=
MSSHCCKSGVAVKGRGAAADRKNRKGGGREPDG